MNGILNDTEECISNLEARIMEITQSEEQTEKNFLNEGNKWDLWNNIKHANIFIIGVLEGEEREKGIIA